MSDIKFDNINQFLEWVEKQHRFTPKVSLDNMRKLCAFFGNPQNDLKYIHVAGTNGKGSIVSFIKNILLDSGYNVASYTSPYVTCFNERIAFNNNNISNDDILRISNQIVNRYDEMEKEINYVPTFFEFITLLAFIYFKEKNPDFVVLEVGMGGLLDSTNVITPIISIISNVAFDHMHILGNTLSEIALNKLGIVKKNIPLVTIENDELNELFKNTCLERNSNLTIVKKNDIKDIKFDELMTFDYRSDKLQYKKIKSNLVGYHQAENIAIVLEAINILNNKYVNVNQKSIYQGIENTFWPGRLQTIKKSPLVLIDGAHNIDGIERLCEYLKTIKNNRFLTIIFAVSKDKERERMLNCLDNVADYIILSKFNYKRSTDVLHLDEINIKTNKRIEENLEVVFKEINSCEDNKIYVFCGSLYFISEILSKYKE